MITGTVSGIKTTPYHYHHRYGQGWGPLGGYWNLNRKSECWSKMAWKYARFPAVWEDYSKTGMLFAHFDQILSKLCLFFHTII